jgi:hypothetical protein
MVSFIPQLPPLSEKEPPEEWMGLTAGLNGLAKRKISVPLLGIKVQSLLVTTLTELASYNEFSMCLIRNESFGEEVGKPHFRFQLFNIFEEKQLQWYDYIKGMNTIRILRSTLILNFKEQSRKRQLSQVLKEIKKKGNCRVESEKKRL